MTTNKPAADRSAKLWALTLIAVGLLSLAANMGWLTWITSWLWATLFAAGGGAFLYYYTLDRRQWWALIPGFTLLGLAAAVVGGDIGGALFLALIGAGFSAVYALDKSRWWAIIPASVLITLGFVAWLDTVVPAMNAGWVFFLGLSATFGVLYILPEDEGRQRWAIFPALATLVLSLVVVASGAVTGIVIPLLLIGAGVLLLWRHTTRENRQYASKREDF